METMVIARRFQGPPQSGNGGYVCGRLAAHIAGPATVRLKQPPPLETPLAVRYEGSRIILLHGDREVAEARPAALSLEVPVPPSPATAAEAARNYRGFHVHAFPRCFVCGPDRRAQDGLRIFPGPLGDESKVAAPWRPDRGLADRRGSVQPEFLWAALDCPGAFSFEWPPNGAVLLGEMTAAVDGPLRAGEQGVVVGWELHREGRKHYTGTAVYDRRGTCIARAQAVWFEVPAVG